MVDADRNAEFPLDTAPRVTPDELWGTQFKRALRGYDASEVDEALERARVGYEQMWRDLLELAGEVEELRRELGRYQKEEDLVRQVLITAQRTAEDIKQGVEERARSIVADADGEADRLLAQARAESERLLSQARAEAEQSLREAAALVEEELNEASRLEALRGEMEAGYRAFLLAALVLLESPDAPAGSVDGGRGEARQAEPGAGRQIDDPAVEELADHLAPSANRTEEASGLRASA